MNYENESSIIESVYKEVKTLTDSVITEGDTLYNDWVTHIKRAAYDKSAKNLSYYLALRNHDVRVLQKRLMPLGISSMGRSESRTRETLEAICLTLYLICNKTAIVTEDLAIQNIEYLSETEFFDGEKQLEINTIEVLGEPRDIHAEHIMVTMPTEAAYDYILVKQLIEAGMDSARINCAHDSQDVWQLMIDNIRKVELETNFSCKVIMDLGGPKSRIAHILSESDKPRVCIGDHIMIYAELETAMNDFDKRNENNEDVKKGKKKDKKRNKNNLNRKCKEDTIDTSMESGIGDEGKVCDISLVCSIPELLLNLRLEDPVIIDDGKIQAKVIEIDSASQCAKIEVLHSKIEGTRIKLEKSLNFPKTPLDVSPLTEHDLAQLDFIGEHADGINYSFVKTAKDIEVLQTELLNRFGDKAWDLAIIAKIETAEAVVNLPEIIIQAAGHQPFGVMIARGDLAVEIGYQRLAEIQEEILWICEAAHIPAIWATQVLDNMAKTGIPSRAEITDAAISSKAECVMLNKGPYVVEAVQMLSDICQRVSALQYKKSPKLRKLQIATLAIENNG